MIAMRMAKTMPLTSLLLIPAAAMLRAKCPTAGPIKCPEPLSISTTPSAVRSANTLLSRRKRSSGKNAERSTL
jgi:hypothetical protein